LIDQVDRSIEETRQCLKEDIIRLVGVKSVKGEPVPGAPFGSGPRAMLDTVLEMGEKEGFYTTDYQVGVVSLALKKGQPDLGIWLHGDVVPEGSGWNWPPFEATEYKGCIIGRGATDNKGQLCAIFHLLKIFKEQGIALNYNPALYVGSDEESGMHDLIGIPDNPDAKGFCNVCTPPRLSLVPDSGFPVGYGANGSMYFIFRSNQKLHRLQITAEQKGDHRIATASVGGKSVVVDTDSCGLHRSNSNDNVIAGLMDRLLDMKEVIYDDRRVLEFFKLISLDTHGYQLGINIKHEEMRPLTVSAQKIETEDGVPAITVNIRYPVGISFDEIRGKMEDAARQYGLFLSEARSATKPYLLSLEWPVLQRLSSIASDITGDDKRPYLLRGATYAHRLPNAIVYGMDGNQTPEDFPEGHGSAHGADESVSLDLLQRAMKIYARALLALNEMEW